MRAAGALAGLCFSNNKCPSSRFVFCQPHGGVAPLWVEGLERWLAGLDGALIGLKLECALGLVRLVGLVGLNGGLGLSSRRSSSSPCSSSTSSAFALQKSGWPARAAAATRLRTLWRSRRASSGSGSHCSSFCAFCHVTCPAACPTCLAWRARPDGEEASASSMGRCGTARTWCHMVDIALTCSWSSASVGVPLGWYGLLECTAFASVRSLAHVGDCCNTLNS